MPFFFRTAAVLLLTAPLSASAIAPAQTDAAKPFAVGSALNFAPPDYLYAGGRTSRGDLSGPVNTSRADSAFFTAPVFERKGNTGRLFYQNFHFANPHDPFLPEESVWFICWQPAGKTGEGIAQRLFPHSGYDIKEIETDGQRLLLRETPVFGSKKTGTVTDTYRWVGNTLGQGKFVPEGAAVPQKHILPPPSAFQTHRDNGYRLLSRGDAKAADTAFAKALALRSSDAACWYARGVAAEKTGGLPGSASLSRAIAAYGKAIALQPARTPAYRRRAALLATGAQYDRALTDLTTLIQQEPTDYENYLLRAETHARKGDFIAAAADATRAMRIAPTETGPYTLLAGYQYRSGSFGTALLNAQKALKLSDSENAARLVLVYIYACQNDLEKAKKVLKDAENNGITRSERGEGRAEIERVRKTQGDSAALKAVYEILRGPE